MLKIWQEISFLNFFQLNEPQDDGQGEDAEPGQDAAQGDGGEGGGEGGSETGEDQMAAHGVNFFSITKKTGLFSHCNFLF